MVFLIGVIILHVGIGFSVKSNIKFVQGNYSGSPEDALISFLLDERNSPTDRSHIAIWSLSQIRSEKALPILKELYLNDPRGASCYGKHDSLICQYEIHKAIDSIEKGRLFSHSGLKDK